VLPALLVAAAVASAFAVLTPRRDSGRAYYAVSPEAVVVVCAGTLVATLAGELIAWRYRHPLALLSAAGAGLACAGLLLIFSVGLPLLLTGMVTLLLAAVMALRQGANAVLSVALGAALALGLGAVLYLAFLRPPVVACRPGGGVSMSAPSWWGGGPSSGGATGTRQRTTGTIRQGGVIIEFACEGDRLVELHRR
jgi:hypothetical protein